MGLAALLLARPWAPAPAPALSASARRLGAQRPRAVPAGAQRPRGARRPCAIRRRSRGSWALPGGAARAPALCGAVRRGALRRRVPVAGAASPRGGGPHGGEFDSGLDGDWTGGEPGPGLVTGSGAELADERLDEELRGYAAAALPGPADGRRRAALLASLRGAAEEGLGPDARVLAFGPACTGCGEGGDALDAAVYVPVTAARAADVARSGARFKRRCLQRVVAGCGRRGFRAGLEGEPASLRARLEESVVVQTEDGPKQSCVLDACNLSCQNLLPLYNTHLLRAYARLEPRLPVLACAVVRWATMAGMAGASDRFISPYAWTLLMVYYLQVCHGLPSLHSMGAQVAGAAAEPRLALREPYDLAFLSAPEPAGAGAAGAAKASALLMGFFLFFGSAFAWRDEVASVRLGRRTRAGAPAAGAGSRPCAFRVEDPVEAGRNHAASLGTPQAAALRRAVRAAAAALRAGEGLEGLARAAAAAAAEAQAAAGRRSARPLLQDSNLELWPYAQPDADWQFGRQDGLVDFVLPDLDPDWPRAPGEGPGECRCHVCERRFPGLAALLQHQVDRGHFNAATAPELRALQRRDAAAVEAASRRLASQLGDLGAAV